MGMGIGPVPHWLVSVLVVFMVGIVVDYVRDLLFKGIACLGKKCCGKA